MLSPASVRFRAQIAFVLVMAVAFLPAIVFVYAAMADAEQIFQRQAGLTSHEAGHLARIARPIAALFSNIPLLWLADLGDFRFARAGSVATLIGVGVVMIRTMVTRLWIPPAVAVVIVTGTLCLPGFIFSVMNPTAWPMHLLSLVLAVAAYALLARSHLSSMFFAEAVRRLHWPALLSAYFGRDRWLAVGTAFILLELSLFTYPPNTLVVLVFTAAISLLTPFPARIRADIVCRDVGFLAAGIVVYVLSCKLLYFPVGHFMGWLAEIPEGGTSSEYRFSFASDTGFIVTRFFDSVRLAKDLWLPPNYEVGVIIGYAVVAAAAGLALASRKASATATDAMAATAAIAVCYVVSVAPVIFSTGGVISYRTVLSPTAIVMVVALYLVRTAWHSIKPLRHWPSGSWVAPVMVGILWITTISIAGIVQVAQNELAYITKILRDAARTGADAMVLLDDRISIGPHELRVARDGRGRALLPYESGCFSTYCFTEPGIFAVAMSEIGLAKGSLDVAAFRGPALNGVTCENLQARLTTLGPIKANHTRDFSQVELHLFVSPDRKVVCTAYDTRWLDLSRHADAGGWRTVARIDRSAWRLFLPD